ncbi:MAG: hypothetical protein IE890_05775, partial [Arcobacter sp.]|nr:hypothetical protein [Arcobacter sp.]
IGLFLITFMLMLNESYSSASVLLPLAIFVGFLQYMEFSKEVDFYKTLSNEHKNFYQLNKTKILYETNFIKLRDYRRNSIFIGVFILPILSILFLASQNYISAIIFLVLSILISFSSEIVSRLLFYKTAVSLGLAGNFFMGNQR